MILQLLPSEFPYKRGKFILFFISAGKLLYWRGRSRGGRVTTNIYIACFAIQSHECQPLYHVRQEDYLAVWEGGGYLGFPIVVEVGREPELVAGEHGADVYRHEGHLLSSQQAGTGSIVPSGPQRRAKQWA